MQAPTPLLLMRSRYCAFALDLRDYLLATWHPSTRPEQLEDPAPGLKWLGLTIRAVGPLDVDYPTVEFVARNKLGGQAQRLHQLSRFVLEKGRWYYLDGTEQ